MIRNWAKWKKKSIEKRWVETIVGETSGEESNFRYADSGLKSCICL